MITNIRNRPGESLLNGYVRFRELLDYCRHHELPPWLVLRTFYGGLSNENREELDLASGGVFMKTTIDNDWELLEAKLRNEESWVKNLENKGKVETKYDCIRKFSKS